MEIGVVFPQTELAAGGRQAVDDFIGVMADSGVAHVTAGYHDLGVAPEGHPELPSAWPFPGDRLRQAYTHADPFHELFVLYGYIAGRLDIAFLTGVVVLPQRQTVAVAKAAASLDILCGGRLRLGVGAGWNRVELEAMGGRFPGRGSVLEEQIEVLRRLWTNDVVDIDGRYHTLVGVGIAPLPAQRPIPVWIGSGVTDRATRRVGTVADGWIPQAVPGRGLEEGLEQVRAAAAAAARDPAGIGLQGVVQAGHGDLRRIERHIRRWRTAGASHVALDVRWSPENDAISALARVRPLVEFIL